MEQYERPIAVFDSGLGGISVLNAMMRIMPNENYIYFGDSKHAPYGTKTHEEVQRLSVANLERLIRMGAKAVTVACNTATSVAIDIMRSRYKDIPIIGIEPALKPAVLYKKNSTVVVMATKMTLSEPKFLRLMEQYQSCARIIPLACSGIVEFVENGDFCSDRLKGFLRKLFQGIPLHEVDSIVLGCTHYPFISQAIREVVGNEIKLFDGAHGTAMETLHRLEAKNLQNKSQAPGELIMINSLRSKKVMDSANKMLFTGAKVTWKFIREF